MTNTKALENAAEAAGITSKAPRAIIHQAVCDLKQFLDNGVASDDPRCQSLLQLINMARLVLLPTSNDDAKHAQDLTSKAVHIDISTATLAAVMGMKNAASISTSAVTQMNSFQSANPQQPSQLNSNSFKLKLLPRPSRTAFDVITTLVQKDASLKDRARQEAMNKTAALAHRIQKLRAGQRSINIRKRRMYMEPYYPPDTRPRGIESVHDKIRMLNERMNSANGGGPSIATSDPVAPIPTVVAEVDSESNVGPEQSDGKIRPSFSRFRFKHPPKETREKGVRGPFAYSKGVMNDAVGTPDDVMEAFLRPPSTAYLASDPNSDNQTKIRFVLAERERNVYRLLRRRRTELAAMPLGMTEQTRRNAIIEAKQLAVLDLQRVVRFRVCAEMKKMYSLAVQENGCVPIDHLSRLFRRRDPPIYSYTDGYPRITPFDGISEMPPRHPATVTQDSVRMAEFDKSRMVSQKVQRRKRFNEMFLVHFENFQRAISEKKSGRIRIVKGLERYLLEKKRAEERRLKLERIERLRLLRSNDEQAYLNLLKATKNERLLQLVRQTDNYLMQIGAQVERQRETVEGSSANFQNAFVDELSEKSAVPIDAMRRRRDLYYTVTHSVQEDVKQPTIMINGTLKAYQLEGLKWMVSLYNNNLNGILADEMGLGKTIQTISLLTYLVEVKKNSGPYLIIVPLSTMGNWVRELDLWAPTLVKVVYRGDKYTRRKIQQNQMHGQAYNVLLTTYEFIVKDQSVLSSKTWQYIIIDEGHRMKNANCKLAMTLGVKYKSRNRLLLTGTPLQNNLTELWALLNFLLPSIFSSSDTFETWFSQPFESTTLGDSAELEEEETLLVINRLHQVLRPFLLRRLKADVESQLPEKVEKVLHCEMSAWQRVLYRQVQGRMGVASGTGNGGVKAYNNLLMQCKKICNHPYLFYDPEAISTLPEDHLIRASGKFALLQHMLPKLKLHGHRTLIFSQMTAALDYLEFFLADIGIKYLRLDGGTRADDRQELLNMYNAQDSPYFCFLLSTRAGGLGLNLQSADTVIIFDSDWNPMMDLQAQDRAHRIGQTKVVRVYRLICSGTVEVKILEQANRKLQVDAQVIQAGQFNNKSTELDRHQMLKDLLRQKSEEDALGDIPTMTELNRMFARSAEEFESFCEYDETCARDESFKLIFKKDDELPSWVLQPEIEHKTAEEREQEIMLSHGRGRRKRRTTIDMDMLTEAEWFKVMGGDMTVEEVLEKRRKRKLARSSNAAERKSAQNDDDSSDEIDDDDDNQERNTVARDADLNGKNTPSEVSGAPLPVEPSGDDSGDEGEANVTLLRNSKLSKSNGSSEDKEISLRLRIRPPETKEIVDEIEGGTVPENGYATDNEEITATPVEGTDKLKQRSSRRSKRGTSIEDPIAAELKNQSESPEKKHQTRNVQSNDVTSLQGSEDDTRFGKSKSRTTKRKSSASLETNHIQANGTPVSEKGRRKRQRRDLGPSDVIHIEDDEEVPSSRSRKGTRSQRKERSSRRGYNVNIREDEDKPNGHLDKNGIMSADHPEEPEKPLLVKLRIRQG